MTTNASEPAVSSPRLLAALADQLKRSEYRKLPLPYVWYHSFQRNWWLSSDARIEGYRHV